MEFGILFTSHPNPKSEVYPHRSMHARVTREILEAEALGFDSIWIAEHQFSNIYGILPDPFTYLGQPLILLVVEFGLVGYVFGVIWRISI